MAAAIMAVGAITVTRGKGTIVAVVAGMMDIVVGRLRQQFWGRSLLLMPLPASPIGLLLLPSLPATGKCNRSGCRKQDNGTGSINITTQAEMCGCWGIGRNGRLRRDTGHRDRCGLSRNAIDNVVSCGLPAGADAFSVEGIQGYSIMT